MARGEGGPPPSYVDVWAGGQGLGSLPWGEMVSGGSSRSGNFAKRGGDMVPPPHTWDPP